MKVSKHHMFVGCDTDAKCYSASIPSGMEVSAREDLDEKLNIVRSECVQEAAKIYLEQTKTIGAKRRILVWDTLSGLFAMQIFPLHISHSISNKFNLSTLF